MAKTATEEGVLPVEFHLGDYSPLRFEELLERLELSKAGS